MRIIYSNPWGFRIHSPYVFRLVTQGLFKRKTKSSEKINTEWHLNSRQKRKLIHILNLIEYIGSDKIILADQSSFPGRQIMEILQNDRTDNIKDNYNFPGNSPRITIDPVPFLTLPEISDEDFWILTNLKNHKNRSLFREKQHNALVSITIETYNMGIIIYNSSFQKQNYYIRCWF
jgi:hypothetical protein